MKSFNRRLRTIIALRPLLFVYIMTFCVNLIKKKTVILLLLDLKAVFDTVNHSTLLTRLSTPFGIDAKSTGKV